MRVGIFGFLFLEQQMMTYSAVARGGVVRTSRTTAQKGTFMMLKCGSSSYLGEHENSRTCLGAHIAFSSAENQGVNQSQMNCSGTISDDTGEMAGSDSCF